MSRFCRKMCAFKAPKWGFGDEIARMRLLKLLEKLRKRGGKALLEDVGRARESRSAIMLRKPAIEGSNTVTEKLVAEVQPTEHPAFNEFVATIEALRSPDGCPWDREQTFESLKKCLADETEEVFQAIDNKDMENLCEELGDVLLQVILNSQIAKEEGRFTIDDVIDGLCRKMVRRHPHVFGGVKVNSVEEGTALWNQIKMQEKAKKP
mgnify:CR=1 FL=1